MRLAMVLSIALGLTVLAGCGKEESKPVPPRDVKTPSATQPAATQPTNMTTPSAADAQSLLDQAMQYIKDKKWDRADEVLKKLEAMKSSLPASMAAKVDAARAAYTAGKGGLPTLPN